MYLIFSWFYVLFGEHSFTWPNVLMSSFGEIITQSFLFLDVTTKTLDVSDTLQYLAGRLQRTRISFAFSNCNRLVSEVTFTLFSTGADNESGLTLDCSFSFQQRERERERLGRQTNSLKGQILAMGREAAPPPAPTYPMSALHHLHLFQYVPESRLNPFLSSAYSSWSGDQGIQPILTSSEEMCCKIGPRIIWKGSTITVSSYNHRKHNWKATQKITTTHQSSPSLCLIAETS